jgi:hypothetical protein
MIIPILLLISITWISCTGPNFIIGYNFDKYASHKEISNLEPGVLYKIKIGRNRYVKANFDSTSANYKMLYYKNEKMIQDSLHVAIIESIEKVRFPLYRVIGTSIGLVIDIYLIIQYLPFFLILQGRNS